MKKALLIAALAMTAGAAHADLLQVSAFGGYSTFNMSKLNSTLDANKASAGDLTKDTRPTSGYMAGVEVGSGLLIPIPFTQVELRGELDGPGEAEQTDPNFDYKIDSLLTSVMLGLKVSLTPPLSPLGFGVGAYGGYGYAVLKTSVTGNSQPSADQYTGSGFVGELEAKLSYKIIPLLSLDVFGGMRFANFASVTDGNQTLKDGNNADLPIDFSGVDGGAGLTLSF
jgi:opacity protein-like surface antigen